MSRRPPRPTLSDTRFPHTTLFRSLIASPPAPPLPRRMRDAHAASRAPADRRLYPPAHVQPVRASRHRGWRDRRRPVRRGRSEEHTSELPSLMRTSYAVFCLKKKKDTHIQPPTILTIKYYTYT